MLNSRRVWDKVGPQFYDFIVVDEVITARQQVIGMSSTNSRRRFCSDLTATPERMDGASVAADFGNRFAAEIRLPEALEEKLLCPFHYFGVADPVSLGSDRFWTSGKYDVAELENVYTGAHAARCNGLKPSLLRFPAMSLT